MRFDLFLYGWIDICRSSIYMYAVRFIFVRFYYFFFGAVLILNKRVSLICARLILYERVLKILSLTERHIYSAITDIIGYIWTKFEHN